MKLIPTYPYQDLDGTPHPGCDHQHQTTDASELAVIRGMGDGIIKAGIPDMPARAGEIVDTTWGCAGNKRLKTRKAFIYSVAVGVVRHPQSMFYRPQLRYCAWHLDKEGKPLRHSGGMALTQFTCAQGEWAIAPGEWLHPTFHLEWVSPKTGEFQRVAGRGVHIISK